MPEHSNNGVSGEVSEVIQDFKSLETEEARRIPNDTIKTVKPQRTSGEKEGSNVSETPGKEAGKSVYDPKMIHTALLEKDNPFLEQDNGADQSTSFLEGVTHNSNTLVNPNEAYDDDNDDGLLPLKEAKTEHSDGSSSKQQDDDSFQSAAQNSDNANLELDQSSMVKILEAKKTSEGQGRNYVAYTIKFRDVCVRRRYSDFESLRNVLVRLFPITLIPPIPEKESIKTYGKAIAGSSSKYQLPSDPAGSVDLTLSVINGSVNNLSLIHI